MPAVGTCPRWVLVVPVLVALQGETAGRQPVGTTAFPPVPPVVATAALPSPVYWWLLFGDSENVTDFLMWWVHRENSRRPKPEVRSDLSARAQSGDTQAGR